MNTTMDSAGRLVIPAAVRRAAGIVPGTELEIRCVDGRIEIEPAPQRVKLVRRGRFVVAVPKVPVEPLTNEVVQATRRRTRRGEDT